MNNSEENIFARERAIKYIGISKKTETEVIRKLKGLKVTPSVIDDEIEYLKDLGFIDDNSYAKSYVKQCEKLLNYSIYEITNKLLQKGISSSIIEENINDLRYNGYEKRVIDKLYNGKLKAMDDTKKKMYLYRRGFKLNEA